MKTNTQSYASCIATISNNTYSFHSTTILTHSVQLQGSYTCIFFSETKYCYSQNEFRSQPVRYSSVMSMGKANFTNSENSYKIIQNSYIDNFLAVVIKRKRKFIFSYSSKRYLGNRCTLSVCEDLEKD